MIITYFLACDLDAEGGRIVLGEFAKGQLNLRKIHEFTNKTQIADGHLRWDLAELEKEVFAGVEMAALLDVPISGLSVNSWGGDYVLLDEKNRPLQSPNCGATAGNKEAIARLLKKLPLAEIYEETGIPLLPSHSLSQMEADHAANPALFQRAERFLLIADYLNSRFSGMAVCEESLASTTLLYNPLTHAWSPKIVAALNLPGSILPRLVPSGTAFGPVIEELKKHPALLNTRVIASCSHNRTAAIAAIPARSEQRWAFLHSDYRSQFGVEIAAPIMGRHAHEAGFTNEVGLGGSNHLFQNVAGLGLVQECIDAWEAAGQRHSGEELLRRAGQGNRAQSHIVPDDPFFHEPGHLPEKVSAYCHQTGQPVPATPVEIIRIIVESLALAHAESLRQLEALIGREIEVIHVVGRGADNELLNQLTADVTGLPVIAGPANASAIGNILIQALALWHLKSPDHLRSIVSSSFPTRIFKPGHAFERKIREKFQKLSKRAYD